MRNITSNVFDAMNVTKRSVVNPIYPEKSYYMRNGAIICPECQGKAEYMCILCQKVGGGEMFCVGEYKVGFHKKCFRCHSCRQLVDGQSKFSITANEVWHMECLKNKK
jgi:hypothetical protein